ncbi:App1 family protein [Lapillicoccus sp.]|uniref:App1 family protein n=1 Tax=Lapillicoccus sp. TaxID=1909287 RepID=UPI003983BBAD
MARPHAAYLIEDAFHRRSNAILRGRGWGTRTISHTGYGSQDFVRVLGRVLLSRQHPGPPVSATEGNLRRLRDTPGVQRGWRAFITAGAMNVPVRVVAGRRTAQTFSDRSGYIDVVIRDPGLEPGWHAVTIEAEGGEPVQAAVRIVDREARLGIVSDIDDTVISTSLPRPFIAAWNTFVRQETTRHLVPGMAPMFRTLIAEHPGAPTFYLSTGAWNTAPTLTRFLKRHGYPAGPMLMTDWGPTNTGWFRSGQEHKRASLDRLARDFPGIRWVLIGDDGQHDPKIYQDFAEARPELVDAILIRQLTPTEQVLSHGLPVSNEEIAPRPQRAARVDVPVFYAPDGFGLLRILRTAGKVGRGA